MAQRSCLPVNFNCQNMIPDGSLLYGNLKRILVESFWGGLFFFPFSSSFFSQSSKMRNWSFSSRAILLGILFFMFKLIFRSGQHACDVIIETEQTREIKAVIGRLPRHLSGGGVCTFCFPVASPSGAYALTPLFVYLPARVLKLSYTLWLFSVHITTFHVVWFSFIFDPGFA